MRKISTPIALFILLTTLAFNNRSLCQTIYITPTGAGLKDGTSWANAIAGATDDNINGSSDLKDAIDNASSGTQIWIAAGIYKPTYGSYPTGDRFAYFNLKNGVAIYGGFAGTEVVLEDRDYSTNVTILSGDIGVADDMSDNSYHVIYSGNDIDNTAIVDGFTITKGNASSTSGVNGMGGGLVIYASGSGKYSNPIIRNIIFTENSSGAEGGALTTYASITGETYLAPLISNCTFINNASLKGGAMSLSADRGAIQPTISNCNFSENHSSNQGGALYIYSYYSSAPSINIVDVSITDCNFDSNYTSAGTLGGGAIVLNFNTNGKSNIEIDNTIFTKNKNQQASAYGGAISGKYDTGINSISNTLNITNSIFKADSSYYGGAIRISVSGSGCSLSEKINNCLFSGNESQYSGGAMYFLCTSSGIFDLEMLNTTISGNNINNATSSGSAIFFNNAATFNVSAKNLIIWGNKTSTSYPQINYSGTLTSSSFQNSNIEGGISGSNNLNSDPLFTDSKSYTEAPTIEGDYSLLICSPSIDSGTAIGTPTNDITGSVRDANPDMGAYEYTAAIPYPTTQASNLISSGTTQSGTTLDWENGDGCQRIVFMKKTDVGEPSPLDNTTYNANNQYSMGDQIGVTEWYCIYSGVDNSVSITGLEGNATYRTMVIEYKLGAAQKKYLTSVAINNPINIVTLPRVLSVEGGGSYCQGTTPSGVSVSLSSSQIGVTYQLKKNGTDEGDAVDGTGTSLIWENLSAGTYTIYATNLGGTAPMSGSAEITEDEPSVVSVSIAADYNNDCPDQTITITATPTNGGTSPSYQWRLNTVNVGTNQNTYAGQFNNGDEVSCVLTSDLTCITDNNATSNTVTINWENTVPALTTKSTTVYLNDAGTVSISADDVIESASDDCGIASKIVTPNSFTCSNLGNNIVNVTVTDNSGNNATLQATVNIVDIIVPTAITQNKTIYLDASGIASITVDDIDNGSFDNCSFLSRSLNKTSFTCTDIGENTVTLTITDGSGNQSSSVATVTVVDNINPIATTKDVDTYLDANGTVTITSAEIDNGSSDNCSIVNYSVSPNTFNCSNLRANVVTLTITDESGNTDSETATVTVKDSIAPIVILQNKIVYLDATGNVSISVDDIDNGSTDNCSIAERSLDLTAFNCSNLGTNSVTLSITDESGNISNETTLVTVVDNIVPTVITQDKTIYLDDNGNITISASDIDNGSYDNCNIASRTLDIYNFNCNNLGENTVTLTITDDAGNVNTNTASAIVKDAINPTAIAKNISVDLDETGNVSISGEQIDNGSYDNCGISLYSVSPSSFSCDNLGANTVTLTVFDASGNSSETTSTVYIYDHTAPIVNTKNLTVELGSDGTAVITGNDIDDGSTDNCGIASLICDATFYCSTLGSNDVTLTVIDNSGNSATGNAIVTVVDNINPTAITKNITVELGAEGAINISGIDIDNGSTDNCSISSYEISKSAFDCSNLGDNMVTLTVYDPSGNLDTETAVVTIIDNTEPTIITKDITVSLNALGEATITPEEINNGSTDNCGIANIMLNKAQFNCNDLGDNVVTLTAIDESGNSSTATAIVTIVDEISPTITCATSSTVQLTDACTYEILETTFDPINTSDNCSVFSITNDLNNSSTLVGAQLPAGINSITWNIIDDSGNQGQCVTEIVVEETSEPIAVAKDITVELDETGNVIVSTSEINNGSYDNCGIATMELSKTSFNCDDLGENIVIFTVKDYSENQSSKSAIITVVDNLSPTVITKNIIIGLNADGIATLQAEQLDNGSFDNCSIASITVDKNNFSCDNIGDNTVNVTVKDVAGNEATATAIITIIDEINPIIECVSTKEIEINSGETSYSVTDSSLDPITVTDNCSYTLLNNFNNLSSLVNSTIPVGETSIVWTITDSYGNAAQCLSIINVSIADNIDELADNGILVFPNPISGKLNLITKNLYTIKVIDFSGKTLHVEQMKSTECTLDFTNYKPGTYILLFSNSKVTIKTKIIKI